jgi:meso-butanediol dehydrogenase / (S,S)-butanediol dehydrogenase / diacetyl reductase
MAQGRLAGKVALVTGAASGIGRATALRLAADGAHVALADRDLDGAEQAAGQIQAAGGSALAFQFDAANGASCRNLVDRVVKVLGRLDILANIAGVMQRGPFAEMTAQTWDATLAVNITALFHVTQQALPHLTETRGCVVNMASVSAIRGVPQSSAYSASKHAVVGLTKSLAGEFQDRHVRVNAIAPGPIDTPLIRPIKPPPGSPLASISWGEPEDVAGAVAYLVSDEAKFVNGTILSIDGGQTAVGR